MVFRNNDYWQDFEAFFTRLFQYLRRIPVEKYPLEPAFIPQIDEHGRHGFSLSSEIDFRKLLKENFGEIRRWREYERLSKSVVLAGAYGDIWSDKDGFQFNHNYIPFITHVLYEKSSSSFRLCPTALQEQYQLIENCIYLESYTFIIKAPVYNLEIQQARIKINGSTFLKAVQLEDMKLFRPSVYHPYLSAQHYSPFLKTFIVTEETRKKGEPSGISAETVQRIKNIISSIVIFKGQEVQLGAFFIEPKDFWCLISGIMSTYTPDEVYHLGEFCTITKSEVSRFRRFYSAYESSAKSHSWMKLLSQRLLRLFYEMKPEDQLVDIMTLFEVAFLPEAETELKYRLATRCAKYLGSKLTETKYLFELIKTAYDIRSNCQVSH